ncbi:unnamed protein product [Amoebophrya sp. A25]|nr:unnamed protein product [Amoebophrya sp. A25]|eukprot:GSA25T00003912001.1
MWDPDLDEALLAAAAEHGPLCVLTSTPDDKERTFAKVHEDFMDIYLTAEGDSTQLERVRELYSARALQRRWEELQVAQLTAPDKFVFVQTDAAGSPGERAGLLDLIERGLLPPLPGVASTPTTSCSTTGGVGGTAEEGGFLADTGRRSRGAASSLCAGSGLDVDVGDLLVTTDKNRSELEDQQQQVERKIPSTKPKRNGRTRTRRLKAATRAAATSGREDSSPSPYTSRREKLQQVVGTSLKSSSKMPSYSEHSVQTRPSSSSATSSTSASASTAASASSSSTSMSQQQAAVELQSRGSSTGDVAAVSISAGGGTGTAAPPACVKSAASRKKRKKKKLTANSNSTASPADLQDNGGAPSSSSATTTGAEQAAGQQHQNPSGAGNKSGHATPASVSSSGHHSTTNKPCFPPPRTRNNIIIPAAAPDSPEDPSDSDGDPSVDMTVVRDAIEKQLPGERRAPVVIGAKGGKDVGAVVRTDPKSLPSRPSNVSGSDTTGNRRSNFLSGEGESDYFRDSTTPRGCSSASGSEGHILLPQRPSYGVVGRDVAKLSSRGGGTGRRSKEASSNARALSIEDIVKDEHPPDSDPYMATPKAPDLTRKFIKTRSASSKKKKGDNLNHTSGTSTSRSTPTTTGVTGPAISRSTTGAVAVPAPASSFMGGLRVVSVTVEKPDREKRRASAKANAAQSCSSEVDVEGRSCSCEASSAGGGHQSGMGRLHGPLHGGASHLGTTSSSRRTGRGEMTSASGGGGNQTSDGSETSAGRCPRKSACDGFEQNAGTTTSSTRARAGSNGGRGGALVSFHLSSSGGGGNTAGVLTQESSFRPTARTASHMTVTTNCSSSAAEEEGFLTANASNSPGDHTHHEVLEAEDGPRSPLNHNIPSKKDVIKTSTDQQQRPRCPTRRAASLSRHNSIMLDCLSESSDEEDGFGGGGSNNPSSRGNHSNTTPNHDVDNKKSGRSTPSSSSSSTSFTTGGVLGNMIGGLAATGNYINNSNTAPGARPDPPSYQLGASACTAAQRGGGKWNNLYREHQRQVSARKRERTWEEMFSVLKRDVDKVSSEEAWHDLLETEKEFHAKLVASFGRTTTWAAIFHCLGNQVAQADMYSRHFDNQSWETYRFNIHREAMRSRFSYYDDLIGILQAASLEDKKQQVQAAT